MVLPSIHISLADLSHIEDLKKLFNTYTLSFAHSINEKKQEFFLRDRIKKKDTIFYIAFLKARGTNEAVGFLHLFSVFTPTSIKHSILINDLYVKKEYRKIGVAQELIRKAVDYGNTSGADDIITSAPFENFPFQKLLHKLEFKRLPLHYFSKNIHIA